MVYVSGLKAEGRDGRYCKFLFELQPLNVNYLNFISYCSYIKRYFQVRIMVRAVSPLSHSGSPGSIPGHSMWDSWQIIVLYLYNSS